MQYNLRVGRGDKVVTNDEVVSQTQKIWQNNDWLASIDAFCSVLINMNNLMPEASTPTNVVYLNNPPSTPTNLLNVSLVETLIPTALKELCNLDLCKEATNFVLTSEFFTTNFQYTKGMKELELKVLDYSMLKKTMDGP